MIQNPIFIVGTERSGSNLLRLLLNELPEVTVPHPPHLMRDLAPRIKLYGDLEIDKNFRRLIRDAIRLVDLHFAPWPFKLDESLVFSSASSRDLYAVYAAIYEQYREHSRKPRWACKSTFMIHHVPDILRHHNHPQFIHLVRDVRDVATSARRSVFCHYHPYFVAQLWKKEQDLADFWARQLPSETWLTVRYEDLIAEPAQQMRRICAFLSATYSADLLDFFKRPAAQNLAQLSRSWENVARPVLHNNSGKFKTELSEKELEIIANVIEGRSIPSALTRFRYRTIENIWMWREELSCAVKDRNARLRWRKKIYLWSLPALNVWRR